MSDFSKVSVSHSSSNYPLLVAQRNKRTSDQTNEGVEEAVQKRIKNAVFPDDPAFRFAKDTLEATDREAVRYARIYNNLKVKGYSTLTADILAVTVGIYGRSRIFATAIKMAITESNATAEQALSFAKVYEDLRVNKQKASDYAAICAHLQVFLGLDEQHAASIASKHVLLSSLGYSKKFISAYIETQAKTNLPHDQQVVFTEIYLDLRENGMSRDYSFAYSLLKAAHLENGIEKAFHEYGLAYEELSVAAEELSDELKLSYARARGVLALDRNTSRAYMERVKELLLEDESLENANLYSEILFLHKQSSERARICLEVFKEEILKGENRCYAFNFVRFQFIFHLEETVAREAAFTFDLLSKTKSYSLSYVNAYCIAKFCFGVKVEKDLCRFANLVALKRSQGWSEDKAITFARLKYKFSKSTRYSLAFSKAIFDDNKGSKEARKIAEREDFLVLEQLTAGASYEPLDTPSFGRSQSLVEALRFYSLGEMEPSRAKESVLPTPQRKSLSDLIPIL